jgi:hypothetical protein
MERHLIQPHDSMVVQKALGGLAPRIQLQLGQERVAELRLEREAWAQTVYNDVARERAEAATRGVQVVLDDTRPDSYVEVFFYD